MATQTARGWIANIPKFQIAIAAALHRHVYTPVLRYRLGYLGTDKTVPAKWTLDGVSGSRYRQLFATLGCAYQCGPARPWPTCTVHLHRPSTIPCPVCSCGDHVPRHFESPLYTRISSWEYSIREPYCPYLSYQPAASAMHKSFMAWFQTKPRRRSSILVEATCGSVYDSEIIGMVDHTTKTGLVRRSAPAFSFEVGHHEHVCVRVRACVRVLSMPRSCRQRVNLG